MREKKIIKYAAEEIIPIVAGLMEGAFQGLLFNSYHMALEKQLKDLKPYLDPCEIDQDTLVLLDNIDDGIHNTVAACMCRLGSFRNTLMNLYPGTEELAFKNERVAALHKELLIHIVITEPQAKDYKGNVRVMCAYLRRTSNVLHHAAQLMLHRELDLNECWYKQFIFGSHSFYIGDQEHHEDPLIRMLWKLHCELSAYLSEIYDLAP